MKEVAGSYEVAIVGAGASGLAAAIECARWGLATVVFDEQVSPGGQIYRGVTTTPLSDRSLLGADYWYGETLVRELERARVTFAPRAVVWAVSRSGSGFEIGVSNAGESRLIAARQVIVATGALERPFPIPGWTLPGVLTAGAAQTLLKTSGLAPSGNVVLAGCGPLLYLVAGQLARVGTRIDALLDTVPRGRLRQVLGPGLEFAASPYALKGLAILRDARKATRVLRHVERIEAIGKSRLEKIRYVIDGQPRELPADTLLLHHGVVPNINLANAIGCEHRWDDVQLAFVPVVDEWGASSVPGVAIAGDGAGIGGARIAEARGQLAALAIAHALGKLTKPARDSAAATLRRKITGLARGRRFLDLLFQAPSAYRIPSGDTIVCRCEEVTAQQVLDTVALGCTGPNQMKSLLRCGMGPCQGRLCGLTITELIASARNVAPEAVGYYRLRFPAKPITLGELASLPQTPESIQAVVRIGKNH